MECPFLTLFRLVFSAMPLVTRYDLFTMGTLVAFDGYNTQSDPSVRFTSKITVDPLGHCLEGAEFFPQDTIMGRTGLVLMQVVIPNP